MIAGIIGFFYSAGFDTGDRVLVDSDEVIGVLAVNGWHNLVHIASGLVGLAVAGFAARTYALALGLAYTLIALWGFVETTDGVGALLDVIPVNTEDNVFHLVLGLAGLAAGAATPVGARSPTRTRSPS